jgi:hypothetical protein
VVSEDAESALVDWCRCHLCRSRGLVQVISRHLVGLSGLPTAVRSLVPVPARREIPCASLTVFQGAVDSIGL